MAIKFVTVNLAKKDLLPENQIGFNYFRDVESYTRNIGNTYKIKDFSINGKLPKGQAEQLKALGLFDKYLDDIFAENSFNEWKIEAIYVQKKKNIKGYIGELLNCLRITYYHSDIENQSLADFHPIIFSKLKVENEIYPLTLIYTGLEKTSWYYR